LKEDLSEVTFRLENDHPTAHRAKLNLSGLAGGKYEIYSGSRLVATIAIANRQEVVVELPMDSGAHRQEFTIKKTQPL
jgi:hypothetical protein